MLSAGAFNALLKTLEEPPEHVKFFFATTEPNKIPVTVLSRCQRYDFASISPSQIEASLADICAREQVQAEREALQVVARRAGGSMRDAQSLLEQLLSTGSRLLTADVVHKALGIAPDERVLELIDALARHDAAAALQLLDQAAASGVQPVEALNGLLEFLRDAMVLAAGADVTLLAAPPAQRERLQAIVEQWPLDTVLAAQQILAEARGRLRGSPHGRLLVELALLRVARLEDLAELSAIVARLSALESGALAPATSGPAPVKKKPSPTVRNEPAIDGPTSPVHTHAPAPAPPRVGPAEGGFTLHEVLHVWSSFLGRVGLRLGAPLSQVKPTAIFGPNVLVITLAPGYNYVADQCDTPEARSKIEAALKAALGRPVSVRFERAKEDADPSLSPASVPNPPADDLAGDPLVQKVVELFEARRVLVDAEEEARD
jgi:DNA polymerase-3 subunit gamma/tau